MEGYTSLLDKKHIILCIQLTCQGDQVHSMFIVEILVPDSELQNFLQQDKKNKCARDHCMIDPVFSQLCTHAHTIFIDEPAEACGHIVTSYKNSGLTLKYPATIVLDLTAHIFLKNEECAGMAEYSKIQLE